MPAKKKGGSERGEENVLHISRYGAGRPKLKRKEKQDRPRITYGVGTRGGENDRRDSNSRYVCVLAYVGEREGGEEEKRLHVAILLQNHVIMVFFVGQSKQMKISRENGHLRHKTQYYVRTFCRLQFCPIRSVFSLMPL